MIYVNMDTVKPKNLAFDVEPIVPCLRNNREAHLDYLRHLKESVETIRDIVEEAKVIRPLDSSIVSACHYTKHSQELLEYAIGTCPQDSHQRDKKHALAPLIRKNKVYYMEGLGHNLFSVGQFCDADLEVAFRKHSCYVRDTNGVKLIKGSLPSAPARQVLVISAGTPSSTTIDQDVPSISHLPLSLIVQPPISHQGVVAGHIIEGNPFAQADNDPFVNVFSLKPSLEESSSGDVSSAESN
nr:integrase, catalytic region, zinc finger, CCHC-type, peptidase aspartic, catalytic [Tanacetum cinerariifolium]